MTDASVDWSPAVALLTVAAMAFGGVAFYFYHLEADGPFLLAAVLSTLSMLSALVLTIAWVLDDPGAENPSLLVALVLVACVPVGLVGTSLTDFGWTLALGLAALPDPLWSTVVSLALSIVPAVLMTVVLLATRLRSDTHHGGEP